MYDDYMLCKVTLGVLKGASKLNVLLLNVLLYTYTHKNGHFQSKTPPSNTLQHPTPPVPVSKEGRLKEEGGRRRHASVGERKMAGTSLAGAIGCY
jgi:hypothetical protein